MASVADDLYGLLHERFGHLRFRPGQERVIRALLGGRDALAVLPTGAGKSLVYQLTAQMLPGLTLVVSPLLALMRDQVEGIEDLGLEVALVNSDRSETQYEDALERAASGAAKLLYVTPERFEDDEFMAWVRRMDVSLFVVDEAHCISDWGHSFRPSYLGLAGVIERLGHPAILALTATATPWVRRDIMERLGMRDPALVVRGVDRPNLFLDVVRVDEEREDYRVLHGLLFEERPDYPADLNAALRAAMLGSGIIYVRTTRAARETADWLRAWDIPADYYHGQRKKADRQRVQAAFMAGDLRVIAATNAFGMGVDKPDVRFVIHRDVPASPEAYYQEAGRAGRDGEFGRCTLIYRPADLSRAAFLAGSGTVTREDVECIHAGLVSQGLTRLKDISERCGLSRGDAARLVEILAEQGIVRETRGRLRLLVGDFDPAAVRLDAEEHRRAYEHSRVEMMRGYVETPTCRRNYLLNYFGEDGEAERCEMCDLDVLRAARGSPAAEPPPPDAPVPFRPGDRVAHPHWGAGEVQRVVGDSITVLFETVGYKVLAAGIVQEQGLLRAVAS